ncbi:MAG: response regulator transcription factor [Candidatus Omnitrophota bacterium]
MDKLIAMVDDELDLIEMLALNLQRKGFRVKKFISGKELFEFLEKETPDLITLDLMLPEMNGFEICKQLKAKEKFAIIPVIMLTAKDWETDKISGLDIGADDYIIKPFSVNELEARIRAVLRRYNRDDEKRIVNIADMIEIDSKKFEVRVIGEKIDLTRTEFQILEILSQRKGQVLTRDRLLAHLWGEEKIVINRTIDVHVWNLKKKLGRAGAFIQNVRGIGYKLDDEEIET